MPKSILFVKFKVEQPLFQRVSRMFYLSGDLDGPT